MKFKLIDESVLDSNGHVDYDNEDYCLEIDFKDFEEFDEFTYDDSDFEIFMENMDTTHGVHDFVGGEGWIGFSSYEIEDFNAVTKQWMEFWKSKGKLIS
jgi:hypothetical protein